MPIRTLRLPGIFRRGTPINPLTIIINLDSAYRQNRLLRRLSDQQLCDAGLTRTDVATQSELRIWDAPRHWCK